MSNVELDTHFADKSTWGAGPWTDEPDREEWRTEAGLPGLIVRGPSGALCGYVAVTEGHPCFGRDYTTTYETGADGEPDYAKPHPNPVDELRVHGGITYGEACRGRICHVPQPGEPDNVWWLGFDCMHAGDIGPASDSRLPPELRSTLSLGGTYKDLWYVRREVERLAAQLAGKGGRRRRLVSSS